MNNQAQSSDWKPTACILCECNCGIEVQLGGENGRRLTRFRGDRAHPTSRGYACEKPHKLDYYQNGRDRLLYPQRRKPDGTFETIDWDTAIREVTQKLAAVRDTYGGASIFYYGGGGQGNHLPGAYASATRRALGSRYRSSALAQEKTGEFWVSHRMLGNYTRGDFEHCEVALFLGKNPWYSHSIPRARVTLKEIAKDPDRKMIVVDPRVTKTAQMADIHLQVRPGGDAWLLSAMLAVLVEENLLDHAFLDARCEGLDEVIAGISRVPVAIYCAHAGVAEAKVREAARLIGKAKSVASFEDLGVQMNHHSTLVSYLHRLLWLLTGNLGKQGTQYIGTPFLAVADGTHKRDSPVTGAKIIGGLVPCNAIADEILTDHPKRFRAMIVEAANPAHSLADSKRMRAALEALDTLVVIDVAMTETAMLADYVLPASTQFEKAEATFFNFEFPENYFHLRPPLFPPPNGPLPEAEIHARIVEALGELDDVVMQGLHEAAKLGPLAYAQTFLKEVLSHPRMSHLTPVILYRTMKPLLPEGLAEGAVLWGLALRCASNYPQALARAGFTGSPPEAAGKLFQAILSQPSGTVFAIDTWDEVLDRVSGKVQLALSDLLEDLDNLIMGPPQPEKDFPFVLSAGERRAFTANTIVRDPRWRTKDAAGSLRINPDDAAKLGLTTGDTVRLTTKTGETVVPVEVNAMMQTGHISLPNGMGLTHQETHDDGLTGGIPPNELTATNDRDPYAGTPWHKNVPARLEVVSA